MSHGKNKLFRKITIEEHKPYYFTGSLGRFLVFLLITLTPDEG